MTVKNVTVLVSEWQIVSDDKFHEMPPRKLFTRFSDLYLCVELFAEGT